MPPSASLSILLVASWTAAVLFWLSVCGRKERCNPGRTRKQESGREHKNRKQEEAMIRWPLWCIVGRCSSKDYGALKVIKAGDSKVQGWYAGKVVKLEASVCFTSLSRWARTHIYVACSVIFFSSGCLSDRIHESVFVSGFQLGQWQAGLGLAGIFPSLML